MKTNKIAIITAVVGQGHMSAALALDYWLTEWGYNTVVINAGTTANQDIHKLLLKNKFAYKSFFSLSDNSRISGMFVRAYSKLIEKNLSRVLPKYSDYDVVISTYPMIHPQKGKKNMMLLLDPVVHSSYVTSPTMDYYLSFWDECDLVREHLNVSHIGPLSRPSFYKMADYFVNGGTKSVLKEKLGVDTGKNICLITAGGGWIYRSEEYIDSLLQTFKDTNTLFVFLCGKNKKFYSEMKEKYDSKSNLLFLEWINEEQVALWMSAADYGIAFALAQMVVEAGLCGLPLYIFDYTAGQEEKYRDIIEKNKVGIYINGNSDQKVKVLFDTLQKNAISISDVLLWQETLLNSPEKAKKEFEKLL